MRKRVTMRTGVTMRTSVTRQSVTSIRLVAIKEKMDENQVDQSVCPDKSQHTRLVTIILVNDGGHTQEPIQHNIGDQAV